MESLDCMGILLDVVDCDDLDLDIMKNPLQRKKPERTCRVCIESDKVMAKLLMHMTMFMVLGMLMSFWLGHWAS